MTLFLVIVLVFIIAGLIPYNISLKRKLDDYSNTEQKITNLNVLQDFMDKIGDNLPVDEKIKGINDILIEKYEIKYSTIVVFDGAEYTIKATNVEEKHWKALKKLQEVEIFKDSIATSSPKYITVNSEQERLPYQEMEFGRAKSAIFFPLYIDNVYIGYWIIESGVPHDFDNVDTIILEKIRQNIVSVLKAVDYQRVVESLVRKDLYSELNTSEYLYGEGKKYLNKHTISAMCMFKITNILEINAKSRELGNKAITEVSRYIRDNISENYLFVRYMGPKFVIAFPGVESEGTIEFLNDIKDAIEKIKITLNEVQEDEEVSNKIVKKPGRKKKKEELADYPKLNFVVSTYYKGTGLEEVLKKLEDYIDDTNSQENDISII